MVTKLNLSSNLNQYSKNTGLFYYTQKQVELNIKDNQFKEVWEQSYVICDEYDWIFFDGKPKSMHDSAMNFQKCYKFIGLSGSELTLTEQLCLK